MAEVVEETTEPILSPHTSGLAEFAGALHLRFLGQLHLLPLRVGVFHPHLFHVEVLDVPFIAEMRVIALLNRAIGCESFQPLLLDRILRLPFAAVDLGDVPKNQPDTDSFVRFDSR